MKSKHVLNISFVRFTLFLKKCYYNSITILRILLEEFYQHSFWRSAIIILFLIYIFNTILLEEMWLSTFCIFLMMLLLFFFCYSTDILLEEVLLSFLLFLFVYVLNEFFLNEAILSLFFFKYLLNRIILVSSK